MDDCVFQFNEKEWLTPNTYSENYSSVPPRPGVYLLVNTGIDMRHEVLYVGSSKNLKQRSGKHPVLRTLQEMYNGLGVRFYFKEEQDYISVEKQLIQQTQARFNTQWR
jgi:excinuclease UvrABC nuclease subunit